MRDFAARMRDDAAMVRYRAVVETSVTVDFDCVRCGFAGVADVAAIGVGGASSILGLDREGAKDDARAESLAQAVHEGQVTMSLLPCPKCGHRSRAAVARFVLGNMILIAVLLAIALVIWVVAEDVRRWICSPACVASAIALVFATRKRLRTVRESVGPMRPRAKVPQAVVVAGDASPVRPIASAPPEVVAPAEDTPRFLN